MICPECEENNKDESKFCTACGCSLKDALRVTVNQNNEIHYAAFKKRLIAYFIDNMILLIIVQAKVALFMLLSMPLLKMSPSNISTLPLRTSLSLVLMIFFSWGYFTLMESSYMKATIGKAAMDIIVTDLDGRRISFEKANGRYWGKYISAIILFFGFIMADTTEKKQALHDIMAHTLVVKK